MPRQIKILSFITILFCITHTGFSQSKVISIDISGNSFLSNSDITNMMVTKKDGNFNRNQFNIDLKTIRDRYKSAGYLNAKFSEEKIDFGDDSAYTEIVLKIDEGKKVLIGEIDITGNKSISDQKILSSFSTKKGEPLYDVDLNNDILELLKSYEKINLPFAKVNINDISLYKTGDEEKLKIELNITENSEVIIEQIKIRGNESTDDEVIIRELKLDKNKSINSETLQEMKERLDRLKIFSSVSDLKIYSLKNSQNNNQSGLLVEVVEGNTNTFDGVLGYVPPAGTDDAGYLTGYVNVSFRNLFGSGRKLEATYEQLVQETQELSFRYFEPYIFGLPLNAELQFLQRIQDTTYTRRYIDLKADFPFSDELTVSAIAGFERVIPSDNININLVIADSRTLSLGTEISYDNRDNVFVPTKGFEFKTFYSYGSKEIYNIEQFQSLGYSQFYSVQKYSGQMDYYFSFVDRQSNLLRLFAGEINSEKIEDADFFRIGGSKFIRGYRIDQFLASRLALASLEARFSISRRGFLFGFYDTGYYLKPSDEINNFTEQSGILYGYGIGIRLETGLGLMGVSYALGKDNDILDGILNFGLINDF